MTRNDYLETVERFKFAPLDLNNVKTLIDKRTKLGSWIVQENDPEARAALLDEYDTAVISMNNTILIRHLTPN